MITWSYDVTAKLYAEQDSRPILYFRHIGQESGYGTLNRCFGRDFEMNYAIDARLITLSPFLQKAGLDRRCNVIDNGTKIHCKGSFDIGIGFNRSFYVTAGFRCGSQSPLDLNFTINVTSVTQHHVQCYDWSKAIDQLEQPIYPPFVKWIGQCSTYYPTFSRFNMLGLSQHGYLNMFFMLSQVLQSKCYQHLMEFACRSFFPECHAQQQTVTPSCKDTCLDFNQGCYDEFVGNASGPGPIIKFNVSCTSLAMKKDPSGFPCWYIPVQCSPKPDLDPHEYIRRQNGSTATSVANVTCGRLYESSSSPYGKYTCT